MSEKHKVSTGKANRVKLCTRKVEDIVPKKDMSTRELLEMLESAGGFTAKKLGTAYKILMEMLADPECTKFFSFPACIVSTGTRGVIKEMLARKMVDVVITTCGTLDHDLARIWKNYYHGDFNLDDRFLHQQNVYRLGNILIPTESYGTILEEKLQPILEEIYSAGISEISTKEFVWELGKRIDDKNSIIYWAQRNKIPVFIPGITDGAVGSQIWLFWQTHRDFSINLLKDEQELAEIVFTAKKTGALMVGGGISKHHTIWWNQFREGLDYAVYITTAVEYDGSLSGAQLREAISWGKVRENAKQITVEGDATVLLPLLVSALI
ncbi:MAG: deoxyhypusine synthase [Thermoplasmata archaeon]